MKHLIFHALFRSLNCVLVNLFAYTYRLLEAQPSSESIRIFYTRLLEIMDNNLGSLPSMAFKFKLDVKFYAVFRALEKCQGTQAIIDSNKLDKLLWDIMDFGSAFKIEAK